MVRVLLPPQFEFSHISHFEGPHCVGPDATFRCAVVGFTQVEGGVWADGFAKKHLFGCCGDDSSDDMIP